MALRRLRLLAFAVFIAMTGPVFVPSPASAAAPESDIPGIPLPGAVATGQLGGPIYDVVYRFTVQPGYVIVAGLTGTPGTDFDLYLFDSTATTVLSNQGLLSKSTGPESNEHLAYPSFYGGTYYLDLNGASDVEGTYTLTVQLVQDTTVPTASLLLANGKASTNSTMVPVNLVASGGIAGIAAMAFSPDGLSFGPWQTYTVATTWTFAPGDGVKTLWAKVRSGVAVESAVVSASVVLDTVSPGVRVITPTPNTSPVGLRPTFTIQFDEPIESATWTSHGLVVQAGNGAQVSGGYSYDPRTMTGSFVPTDNLVPGGQYVVTIGPVRDVAGNEILPLGSWLVAPKIPTSLSLAASASVVVPGASVTLSGSASELDGEKVTLEARPGGSTEFVRIDQVTVGGGRISTTVVPQLNTTYRLYYPGSAIAAAATSADVRVLVRRRVALVGVSPATTRTVRAGSSVVLMAQVTPPGGGAHLSFRQYRYDEARRRYVYYRSLGRRSDPFGRASVTWIADSGRYYWRVAVLPSPEFANNISPIYRWTVTGG